MFQIQSGTRELWELGICMKCGIDLQTISLKRSVPKSLKVSRSPAGTINRLLHEPLAERADCLLSNVLCGHWKT